MRSIFDLRGAERAAALLVALGPETAAQIMKHLDEESIDRISVEIAKIDRLSPEEREDLIGDFILELKKTSGTMTGGKDRAMDLLKEAFGDEKAEAIISRLNLKDHAKSFDSLNDIDPKILCELLKDEHPQTVAVVMSFLKPEVSAQLLKGFPKQLGADAALRIARMKQVSPEAASGIAAAVKKKYKKYLETASGFVDKHGMASLAGIISFMGSEAERDILKSLESDNPEISSGIRDIIFSFDNIINLNNTEMRILIDEISDDKLLATALKGAGDEIRFKVLRNMSRNRADDIIEDMKDMGPVKLSDVEDCRGRITTIMRRLHENGEIDLKKDDVYVE
jgi:flagellar motor switch protein FliG